jgi:hypothetical protein
LYDGEKTTAARLGNPMDLTVSSDGNIVYFIDRLWVPLVCLLCGLVSVEHRSVVLPPLVDVHCTRLSHNEPPHTQQPAH